RATLPPTGHLDRILTLCSRARLGKSLDGNEACGRRSGAVRTTPPLHHSTTPVLELKMSDAIQHREPPAPPGGRTSPLARLLLLAIVVVSYWQTIFAYPSGGGSYIVSKDNLGTLPGLVAAAALLIDYVLTVSVSIASGVQNLASIPALERFDVGHHLVSVCL